ncbi:MAG TPA: hypothetical protein VHV29_09775 [Terriglobales bacterium]|jgi:hypothetical protein|nr:hypothetical protein [Terriglobales bacterium]
MFLHLKSYKSFVLLLAAVLLGFLPKSAKAQVTLLLEEPYSYDGTFAGTGHAAVYLSRVCAETPTLLRRCNPGEQGVVLSRYHHIEGRDWFAVPLIPYLYAVDSPSDIPLYADSKLVAFLRQRYLQKMDITGSDAYQLVGSAYDRTTYGFRIETTPEQDDELIRSLNQETNRDSYKLLNRNCADFVKQIVDFYYPHAVHRSVIADLGVMTPKQAAKSLAHSAKHRPQMQLTTFLIPQVPGLKRSKPVHGVLESLVLAKKYVTPVLMFHPFVVAGVEAAYWTGWRFDPAKGALIFDPARGLETPLTAGQRAWYEKSVQAMKRENNESEPLPNWHDFASKTEPQLDATGQPFLQARTDNTTTQIGICRDNALRMSAPPELVEVLLFARLDEELKSKKPAHVSEQQIQSDLKLLRQLSKSSEASLTTGVVEGSN